MHLNQHLDMSTRMYTYYSGRIRKKDYLFFMEVTSFICYCNGVNSRQAKPFEISLVVEQVNKEQ
eukprot:snap_masked-scaffold_13-processed-gene-2.34-mRNA-1 protein AED:1.00 eAED:1.00 QI:0/0/0/0/1/1/3/0/63